MDNQVIIVETLDVHLGHATVYYNDKGRATLFTNTGSSLALTFEQLEQLYKTAKSIKEQYTKISA